MVDLTKLDAFVDAVVNKQDDSENIYKSYIAEKMSTMVREFTGDNPIKFEGDDIYINGKLVGSIDVDINDMDSGINFVSVDKKYSKEVHSMEELYGYLAKQFGVSEDVAEAASDKNTAKALKQQQVRRKERLKAWIDAKKTPKNVEGTDGEYEKTDLVKKHKRPKGG